MLNQHTGISKEKMIVCINIHGNQNSKLYVITSTSKLSHATILRKVNTQLKHYNGLGN